MPTIIDTDRITFNDNSGQFNAPPLGFKNLQASATGTNANVSVTADQLTLFSTANFMYTANSVSLTINTAASGANGLDTGTIATSTWYSVWVIWNGTTTAGLISTSATAPTLPSGYTHKARVGWIRTDGTANKYPLGFKQYGRTVRYVVAAGSNLTALPQLVGGIQGNPNTPTWAAVGVSNFVPTSASRIVGVMVTPGGGAIIMAPNNGYGHAQDANNPPPLSVNNAGTEYDMRIFDFVLESTNIYYASKTSGSCNAKCMGWEDNL